MLLGKGKNIEKYQDFWIADFAIFTIMKIEELYKIYQHYPLVQTDTRKLQKGEIFFALRGPNFNANSFAAQAVEAGAAAVIIDDSSYHIPSKTILVENCLETLQALAHHHRKQFHIPFIAITGSNGKTTTKELVHAVLSTAYTTYTTVGNLNNHIGIPLTLLKIKPDAEMAVVEMGANHPHEIESYCKIIAPTHGLITNVGKAHLEGFGSLDGVKKAKGELFDFLRTTVDGTAFVMWDYDYLQEMSKGIPHIVKYGTKQTGIDGVAEQNNSFLKVILSGQLSGEINTQLIGAYNLPNVLAAVAVGKTMKIGFEKIKNAIENYIPSNSRSQLITSGTNKIILDAYNANPSSMRLAIENFAKIADEHKILILGQMAEMGQESRAEHKNLLEVIAKFSWKDVILVGTEFMPFVSEYKYFADVDEAVSWLAHQEYDRSFFLVKGSRSSKMEKVLPAITKTNL